MSGNLSWYQKHLGTPTPRVVAPPQAVPQFLPGADGRVYRVVPEDPQYQTQPAYGPGPRLEAPLGEINVSDAVRAWKGSRAAQLQTARCPECNSNDFLSKIPGAPSAAGRCYSCGYSTREDLRPSTPLAALTSNSQVRNDGRARSAQYQSSMANGQGFGIPIARI